jgi:N-methylhydantoinase A
LNQDLDVKRLAFDIGGTFTDFVYEDDETVHVLKVPTTPDDPAQGVLDGIAQLETSASLNSADLDAVLHATTVATNAIIERKGGRTALITTEGFRDILIIGRQKRYETYDLYMAKPAPLLRRRDIFEVSERTGFDGERVTPLDMFSVNAAIEKVKDGQYDAVAVALLHSYADPVHERQIHDRLRECLPTIYISISSEVSPKYREYERTNTTVANSYVKPVVSRYIARLQEALAAKGFRNELFIMQSSGGLVSPDFARKFPIRIVESGPAAGVLMARDAGADEGFNHVITFDMGGTTAKLGAVDEGEPSISPTFEIDPVRYKRGSGLPINTPAVELLEIGAGGGSIARAELGTIAVGPDSAGAEPGPVCYANGSTEPTVTDANLILGYLNPNYFNDGAFTLDKDAAAAAVTEKIAAPLDLTTEDAAWGIHLVATNNMEHAIRIVSVERGRDPRRYAMVALGGAGPLHAAHLARKIGVPQVIIPKNAGVGSAIGLLSADARVDASTTRILRLNETSGETIAALYGDLEMRVQEDLARLALRGTPVWSRFAYMRFAGQGFEIHVPLPSGDIGPEYPRAAEVAFRKTYAKRHRFSDEGAAAEAVDWYLVATIETTKYDHPDTGSLSSNKSERKTRSAYFPDAGGWLETEIIRRANLTSGQDIQGPVIIEDPDSTIIVPPGDTVERTLRGHLLIRIDTGESP